MVRETRVNTVRESFAFVVREKVMNTGLVQEMYRCNELESLALLLCEHRMLRCYYVLSEMQRCNV